MEEMRLVKGMKSLEQITQLYVVPIEPLRDEDAFGDHTGYYTLPEPYPSSTSPPSRIARTPSIPGQDANAPFPLSVR